MSEEDKLFSDPSGNAHLYIFSGKSQKGKSHLIKYMLYDRFKNAGWKYGLVFCKTKFNHDYDFLPDNRVIEGYDEEILKKYIENLRKKMRSGGKNAVKPNFIIFEDICGILKGSDFFNNFITMYRHTNTNIIISVQYLTGRNAISPILREQTTHCFIFDTKTKRTLKNLYDSYGQLFDHEDDFKEYLRANTSEKYACVLYIERIDDINNNYIPIKAPKDLPKHELKF